MGLISSAINSALGSIGEAMFFTGEWMLKGGYGMWESCSKVTVDYVKQSPMTQTNAWQTVTGPVYSLFLGIASSLTVLFFLLGWFRESVDVRNNFTLDHVFRFFIRYIVTVSLITNSLALVTGIAECGAAVVSTIDVSVSEDEPDVFTELKESIDAEDGGAWFQLGVGAMIGGLIGGLVIIVCGISLVLSVLSRLFKMLLCIPFAPVAFAGFAGGHEFAQSGIAWLRTFIGYALEAAVITLAIKISFGMFADAGIFQTESQEASMVTLILQICEYCMPMIAACACVKGAETTVRRCLGLG